MNNPKDDLAKIIIKGDTKLLVEKANSFGSDLAIDKKKKDERGRDRVEVAKLTTSQIRNFFGTVKKIESKGFDAEGEREFLLLKPKLAYAAKKAGESKLNYLRDVLTDSIDLVISDEGDKKEKFRNFCNLFESILCYHKASGGGN
jgi:CRISPR-associated protein Csm2